MHRIIRASLHNRFLVLLATGITVAAGIFAITKTPMDAIPNIGENQVIVYAEWPGRSPRDVEDQITYPLTISLMGLPRTKVVRAASMFGRSTVYVIFEDGVDYYWARSRVFEKLDFARKDLPAGVIPTLGPDATGLGQVFWYTVDNGYYCPDHPQVAYENGGRCPVRGKELVRSRYDLGELRSLQDWYIKYQLSSVPDVAEVASVGGFVKQYQVDVDPNALLAHNVTLDKVIMAVKTSNIDVGAKVIEEGGMEFIVRGVGFVKGVDDIEDVVVAAHAGVPVYVKNVATVTLGPDFRRGALDKEGMEATGGVVLMRYGANPLAVIKGIKEKIREIRKGLPPGVVISPFYDRSALINRSTTTLSTTLIIEIIITLAVILLFLMHFRSSFVVALLLPFGLLIGFILMRLFKVDANIMSLGGIAIAIGVMVDASIVVTENIYRRLSEAYKGAKSGGLTHKDRLQVIHDGAREVAPAVVAAIATTIVSFVPVFALPGQSGKLFQPLAFTKTFVMFGAAVAVLTLVPVLSHYLLRGRLRPFEENWMAVRLKRIYEPVIRWGVGHKLVVVIAALAVLLGGIVASTQIKREFMPPLEEGDLLFMPVLLPAASLTRVMDVMRTQDIIIKGFPEVEQVVGKLGRAETATDPAPVSMIETVVRLKPAKSWRKGMTRDKLVAEMNAALKIPGVSNIWTQPIRNRIDMLATGIQTPIGIKVFGGDQREIERVALEIEQVMSRQPGATNVFAERASNRPYLEIEPDRRKIARYGIKLADVQRIIMTGIGGMNLGTIIEGRERFPVRVRYARELRDNVEALRRLPVPTPGGFQVPLHEIADIRKVPGPAMTQSENTLTYSRVFINIDPKKVGTVDFVERGKKVLGEMIERGELKLPPGYYISWSGQYEAELEARNRLILVLPFALLVILFILYMTFKSPWSVAIVSTGLPVSLMGGVLLLYFLRFNFSVAVWVGFIALFGVATDNAVVLVKTLDDIFRKKVPATARSVREAVVEGSLLRVRPIMMTTVTTIMALVPIMFIPGSGSEIMRPMATPTIGGLVTATLSNLILVPVIYAWVRERRARKAQAAGDRQPAQ